jgi:hypothetical protein
VIHTEQVRRVLANAKGSVSFAKFETLQGYKGAKDMLAACEALVEDAPDIYSDDPAKALQSIEALMAELKESGSLQVSQLSAPGLQTQKNSALAFLRDKLIQPLTEIALQLRKSLGMADIYTDLTSIPPWEQEGYVAPEEPAERADHSPPTVDSAQVRDIWLLANAAVKPKTFSTVSGYRGAKATLSAVETIMAAHLAAMADQEKTPLSTLDELVGALQNVKVRFAGSNSNALENAASDFLWSALIRPYEEIAKQTRTTLGLDDEYCCAIRSLPFA